MPLAAASPPTTMTTAPPLALPESTATHLVFTLHGSLYAVDALAVREILWLPEVTPVEAMPAFVVGVLDRRGQLVPVIDLAVRLGRPRTRYRTHDSIIILECGHGVAGVIVNEVLNVGRLVAQDLDYGGVANGLGSPGATGGEVALVAGVATAGEDIVTLLEPSALWHGEAVGEAVDGAAATLAEALPAEPDRYFCPQATPPERALFRDRATALMQPLATQDYAGLWAVAVVVLDGEYFGIDLNLVREFAPIRQVTPVPCCPPHIVGQMNLRGDILTLVDIRAALQMPAAATTAGRQVMVVQVASLRAGVLVDEVLDVLYLQPADIKPVPTAVQSLQQDYLRGTAPRGDRMLGLLDLARILARPDLVVTEEV